MSSIIVTIFHGILFFIIIYIKMKFLSVDFMINVIVCEQIEIQNMDYISVLLCQTILREFVLGLSGHNILKIP